LGKKERPFRSNSRNSSKKKGDRESRKKKNKESGGPAKGRELRPLRTKSAQGETVPDNGASISSDESKPPRASSLLGKRGLGKMARPQKGRMGGGQRDQRCATGHPIGTERGAQRGEGDNASQKQCPKRENKVKKRQHGRPTARCEKRGSDLRNSRKTI